MTATAFYRISEGKSRKFRGLAFGVTISCEMAFLRDIRILQFMNGQ